jgi:ABC-type branched-subunit amino acid transport system permease subunit
VVLHFLSESRTGRAWKASREDPLAAELMGMPVNRLKIMAFSVRGRIAGLAGSVFAAAQTGAFPQNFSTQVLILIYAVVILGGAGSLTGMLVGAATIIVSFQVLDSTSPPNNARVLFYLGLLLGVRAAVQALAPAAGGRARVHDRARVHPPRPRRGLLAARDPRRDHLGRLPHWTIRHWVLVPTHSNRLAVYGLPAGDRARDRDRPAQGLVAVAIVPPTIVVTAFVWENLLIQQPAVTRYVLFGALLIGLMASRPQGLFGSAKVEIV